MVTSSPMWSTTSGGHAAAHTPSIAAASSAATSTATWLAVADDVHAADHDVADVGGGGGEHQRASTSVVGGRRRPGGRESRPTTVTRSAERAGREATGVGPAEERGAADGGRRQQVGRRVVAADAGGQPLVELHRPRLLEQVDHRVGVGTRGTARAPAAASAGRGPMPSARSRSVVGQMQHATRRAEGRDVGGGEVGGVDRGEPGPSGAGVGQDLGRACGRRRPGSPRSRPAAR